MARRSWKSTKEFSKRNTPEALPDIREEALMAFFNRFCEKEVDTMRTRESRRKVVHWLDRNNVKIQESNRNQDFIVMIPEQTTGMHVEVYLDEDSNLYKYKYTLVNKHNLEPLEEE